jgi:hypothetical protein
MGRQLRLGVLAPSIERFVRMADENGDVVLNNDGIWQKQSAPLGRSLTAKTRTNNLDRSSS